ncbi:MAG: RNA 2',3'-cyclic phosphodiesterase [Endomicrobiales bacterium]|nr:RNA 2',3'-cyclic phosphodiesterase [Endomicrobiales bacterium]
MRLFIALNIPDDLKNKIADVQNNLKRSLSDVKWVGQRNFHLTLKFLGETPEEKVNDIISSLTNAVSNYGKFQVAFCGTGVFPDIHRPRVVWIGIREGKEKLEALADKIEEEMFLLDFPKEKRKFSAHLTLGRVKSQKNKYSLIKKVIANEKTEAGSHDVLSIDLMQSILHPQGPEYICLKSVYI